MAYTVNFKEISTEGLESSPFADELAKLRADAAKYVYKLFKKQQFITEKVEDAPQILDSVNTILKCEKDLTILSTPLEVAYHAMDGFKYNKKTFHTFYKNGLVIAIDLLLTQWPLGGPSSMGVVRFQLSNGAEIPPELEGKFKFKKLVFCSNYFSSFRIKEYYN